MIENMSGLKQAADKFISAEGDGLQAVHDCFEMNSALAPFPNTVAGVAVGAYGRKLYLADSFNAVYVIDTSTNTISDAITVPGSPAGIAVRPLKNSVLG